MEDKLLIYREEQPHGIRIRLEGRMDGYWSRHLDEYLEDQLRSGAEQISLHMEGVSYLSSLGIRVLVKYTKQFKQINGTFGLECLSEPVQSVLDMVGLTGMLSQAKPSSPARSAQDDISEKDGIHYHLRHLASAKPMRCFLTGVPGKLAEQSFTESDCITVPFRKNRYGIGLGAIGSGFEDCRSRFGECIGLGDAVVFMPAGHAKSPDYTLLSGGLVPELQLLYGILFEGPFAYTLRFSARESGRRLPLSQLLNDIRAITGCDQFVMVMLAEASGLVGTSLSVSPAAASSEDTLFSFPAVREQFNFTTEPEHQNMMTITAGLVSRTPSTEVRAFTRPCPSDPETFLHLHSAVFSYAPLRNSDIDLDATIATFFEEYKIQDVMHLIQDHREALGAGESEFLQGTCWISPVASTEPWNKEVLCR